MNRNKNARAIGWCDYHGKLLYTDRKLARGAARKHPEHKGTFECQEHPEMWHIGALPREVIRGEVTRSEFFERHVS